MERDSLQPSSLYRGGGCLPAGRQGLRGMKGTPMKLRRILVFPLNLILSLSLIFFLSSPSTPQPKDPGKISKVAILPFLIHSQENLDYLREGIYDILSSRISVEGRIAVIDKSAVERALYEERPMRLDEAVAKKIGQRVGADYAVLGSLTKIGEYISLDAHLISVTEEKPPVGVYTQHKGIEDVMLKIGDFAEDMGYRISGHRPPVSRPGEQKQASIERRKPEEADYKKTQSFGFEIKGLDIGDVDGDKKNEIVVMDRNNLYVFKYDGEKIALFQKIAQGSEHNFLTLDVADVNRNGVAEIIVTSVIEDNLQSFILEFEQGKFKRVMEKENWYFRVLDPPKEGPILMGQRMGSEGIFAGPIYQFVWKKNAFKRGSKMSFPDNARVFGLTVADLRKTGKPDAVFLNDKDQLYIVDQKGKLVWKDKRRFGGSVNFYETSKKLVDGSNPARERLTFLVYIPGRILSKDLDGDGIPEVIINSNGLASGKIFDKARTYDTGEIYALIWEENVLVTNWKTKQINGYIADFQIKDADNDGEEDLVVAVMPLPGDISGKIAGTWKSHIRFFKIF
jgi:TolB-like protein